MKKLQMLIGAAALAAAFSYGQPAISGAADAPQPQPPQGSQMAPDKFPELKARLLERLEERMKRMQAEKACIESAKSQEDLQKCRPERPGPPRQEGPGGQMMPGQRGPMAPMPSQQPGGPR
ncbi:MAG: hypothetical protein OHK006_05180 [Thermodesulfovibrionales bacterium]